VPIIFITSSILLPLLWILSYLSIPVISFVTSLLSLAALAFNIYFTSKAFKKVNPEINPVLNAFGFLIPFIGVWYIQPMVNRSYLKTSSVS
jgi:RsiW-degrading membrane proteinase PrsW (M82 family)